MKPPMKRIIVCCDGTWNDADTQTAETNVALMARSIHAYQDTGGVLQVVLYLRGVGTTGLHFETVFDGATGHGIADNILCRLYVPRAKLLSRRRDLSVRLFARRLYGAQPRRIYRGLRRAEAPKARRSGPGLAILSRSRPSLAARLHAVEPFGLSRRRHDQIPRRLGHGGRARDSRVAVREARQAAVRLSQHRPLLRGEARLSRHGDRGASGGVHADAVDGDGAGGRSHRASVVRRRAFRCRRGLRHARPGRHSAGLDGEKGRGRRAGARLVLPARSEQPRSPRANPRLRARSSSRRTA